MLSCFTLLVFLKYNLLSDEENYEMSPSSNPTLVGNSNDDKSLDSASNPTVIHVSDVMKAAAFLWKRSTIEHKD